MVRKLSVLLNTVKRALHHLFPDHYESIRDFAKEAWQRHFKVTIRELFLPNIYSQNSESYNPPLPSSNINGIMYFRVKGVGNGEKSDIICDIPIGYYDMSSDITEFQKTKDKKMNEIMEELKFFFIPVTIQEIF